MCHLTPSPSRFNWIGSRKHILPFAHLLLPRVRFSSFSILNYFLATIFLSVSGESLEEQRLNLRKIRTGSNSWVQFLPTFFFLFEMDTVHGIFFDYRVQGYV